MREEHIAYSLDRVIRALGVLARQESGQDQTIADLIDEGVGTLESHLTVQLAVAVGQVFADVDEGLVTRDAGREQLIELGLLPEHVDCCLEEADRLFSNLSSDNGELSPSELQFVAQKLGLNEDHVFRAIGLVHTILKALELGYSIDDVALEVADSTGMGLDSAQLFIKRAIHSAQAAELVAAGATEGDACKRFAIRNEEPMGFVVAILSIEFRRRPQVR